MISVSTMAIDQWRGDLTRFASKFSTLPMAVHIALMWAEIVELLAPSAGPMIVANKDNGMFAVPCRLRTDVSYTGRTAEKFAPGAVGAMRSARHMTVSTVLIFEFDGLTIRQLKAVLGALAKAGIALVVFTSHSHGRVDRPGWRVRVVIPVDEPLDRERYRALHEAINDNVFGGLADRTGAGLHQQQGVWSCPQERRHLASRRVQLGGVLSVASVPAIAPKLKPPRGLRGVVEMLVGTWSGHVSVVRLQAAMPLLVAVSYSDWSRGLTAFKALAPHLGVDAAREMALRFAATSPVESRRIQEAGDSRYDPESFFDRATPMMTADVAAGTLLKMAKDQAVASVEATRGKATASDEGRAAALYLATYHRAAWKAMGGEVAA